MTLRSSGQVSAAALFKLFEAIETTFFDPHPLTLEEARRITAYEGADIYEVLDLGGDLVAYGILRGWDDGYEVPSLGIAVRRDRYGEGFGRAMMEGLHEMARDRGAAAVRLRVHSDNLPARKLYERLGYRYAGTERGELVMVLDL